MGIIGNLSFTVSKWQQETGGSLVITIITLNQSESI